MVRPKYKMEQRDDGVLVLNFGEYELWGRPAGEVYWVPVNSTGELYVGSTHQTPTPERMMSVAEGYFQAAQTLMLIHMPD